MFQTSHFRLLILSGYVPLSLSCCFLHYGKICIFFWLYLHVLGLKNDKLLSVENVMEVFLAIHVVVKFFSATFENIIPSLTAAYVLFLLFQGILKILFVLLNSFVLKV